MQNFVREESSYNLGWSNGKVGDTVRGLMVTRFSPFQRKMLFYAGLEFLYVSLCLRAFFNGAKRVFPYLFERENTKHQLVRTLHGYKDHSACFGELCTFKECQTFPTSFLATAVLVSAQEKATTFLGLYSYVGPL